MNQFIRSIAVLLLSAWLMQDGGAQFYITGPGFVPDENGTNLDDQQPKKVAAKVAAGTVVKDCAECPEMVVIPAGSLIMGSLKNDDEKPTHSVTVRGFLMGNTEVTQRQWQGVMGKNPSRFAGCGLGCPVEMVSWDDIQQFIARLNQKTGQRYRLPSEAEWEYAARAGTTTEWNFGDDESEAKSAVVAKAKIVSVDQGSSNAVPTHLSQGQSAGVRVGRGTLGVLNFAVPLPSGWSAGSLKKVAERLKFDGNNLEPVFAFENQSGGALFGTWRDFKVGEIFTAESLANDIPSMPSEWGVNKSDILSTVDTTGRFDFAVLRAIGMGDGYNFSIKGTKRTVSIWIDIPIAYQDKADTRSGLASLYYRGPVDSFTDAKAFLDAILNGMNATQVTLISSAEFIARTSSKQGGAVVTSPPLPAQKKPSLGDYAWYSDNSGDKTQIVKQKLPNAFGLYDMHGNVFEWTQDCWHNDYNGAPTDGSAWTTRCQGSQRVLRGGSWRSGSVELHSASRYRAYQYDRDNHYGFRLARDL